MLPHNSLKIPCTNQSSSIIPNSTFAVFSDYKTLSPDGGYWQEQIPKSEAALCAAIDPAADFRWHSLNCGGPETASFICELPGTYL
jgi:hypothetical protein